MSDVVYPHIHGLAFDVKPRQISGTVAQPAWGLGRETRLSRGPDVLHGFTLHYRVLDDGKQYDSFSQLEAFFHDHSDFDSFLLKIDDVSKTTQSTVTGQTLTPDGSGYAPFVRKIGTTSSVETIFELAGVNGNPGTPPVVKMSGTPLSLSPAQYQILGPDVALSGITYPGMVAQILIGITGPITADFQWYYRVKFEQSEQEYEMFHFLLYEAQEVKLVEIRES